MREAIWHREVMWKKQLEVLWLLSENRYEMMRGLAVFEYTLCVCFEYVSVEAILSVPEVLSAPTPKK